VQVVGKKSMKVACKTWFNGDENLEISLCFYRLGKEMGAGCMGMYEYVLCVKKLVQIHPTFVE
jgi:hypothetical protein